jgi:multiple sugar transport system permease protein
MSKSKREKRHKMLVHLFLILGSAMMLIPFIWMVLTSFKTVSEAVRVPPTIFPDKWSLKTYKEATRLLPFGTFYFNTFMMVVIRVIVSTLFASMAAYGFARLNFPFKNALFIIVLIQLMVPPQIFIIPQYIIAQKLGWLDSIMGLALPGLVTAFGTFLLRQFFMGIPKEMEEAAIIDGANRWQIYWHVMLPLAKSGMIALSIFTALFAFQDLMWPLIVNTSVDKLSISAGLATLKGQFTTNYPVLMAGSVIAIIPMLAAFGIFQKQFIQGISMSGSKG